MGERARNRSVTCCSHFDTGPHAALDATLTTLTGDRDERGNGRDCEGMTRSLGQRVKRSRTDTRDSGKSSRTLPRSHATCTSASSRETYLKRLRARMGPFSFPEAACPGTRDDGELTPGSLPASPRQTTRRTHSAWESRPEDSASSRENKTGKN